MKDIILSEKHGVNPSIEVCTVCGSEMSLVLFGKLENDEEAPKKVCLGHICDKCNDKFTKNDEVLFVSPSKYAIISRKNISQDIKDTIVYISESLFDKTFK